MMTAKIVRRTRRLDGPMLSEVERLCFNQLNDKLAELRQAERTQITLLGEIVKCMADACEHDRIGERLDAAEQRLGLTRPGPHLSLVRGE